MSNLNNYTTLPGNQQMVRGLPIGKLNNLDSRVSKLEQQGTGGVSSIIAGTNITISPINGLGDVTINATGGGSGSGYQTPTGTVNGSNTVFTWGTAPNAIVVDGVTIRKVASDTTVNWTGTTTTTLTIAPNFDCFAVC